MSDASSIHQVQFEAITTSPAKLHVVWLMCDQLRADALGFAGNSIVQTPNLDRLARLGEIFDNLFALWSVCISSTLIYTRR